ncbi:MAG: LysM peptidoglycan-binding domain-containing protein [Desulfovibrionales bacterium]
MKKLILLTLCLSLFFAWGCAKKQVTTTTEPEPQVQAPAPEPEPEPAPAPAPQPEPEPEDPYLTLPTSHTVVKGECLWWIAEYTQIYNDPFMWPLIYKANRDQINDPDLIYPGQTFEVPRQFGMDHLKESRRMAGAPKPYSPPSEANLPEYIRAELGWGN